VAVLANVLKRVGLIKLERVARLWFDIHSDNLKAGQVIAITGAASLAEQIK
jgi:hypothetical protein